MGASGSSESGSQTYLVAPLFLTMAGMIVSIPVICLIINCLHKRRVRRAASSSKSSASAAAPVFQRIPASWQMLFKNRSREEWLNLATLQKTSMAPGKDVDVEIGSLDKVHLAARNNVKGRAAPSRGTALSSTALPKNVDDDIKDSRSPLAYETLQTPSGDLSRSESQKTYNSTATTITPDFNRSTSTRTTASQRLPIIWPDKDGYYRPKLASSPSTSSESTKKAEMKRHLEVPSWDVDKVGETDGDESMATNLRAGHQQNERLQKSPLRRLGDDLKRSGTSADRSDRTSSASSANSKGKEKPKREGKPWDAQNQNLNQNHDQKSNQVQKDTQKEKQSRREDITEVFNLQRQQSKARKQRELDEILGPPSFSGTGSGFDTGTAGIVTATQSAEGNPGVQSVDDEDEDLAFSQAEMHGDGHGVVGRDFA